MSIRYVRVEKNVPVNNDWYLHFAELEVYNTNNTNVARSETAIATASSSYASIPSWAIDGNTEGQMVKNSIWHSNDETNPWWEVDLGTDEELSSVKIYNRTDYADNINFYTGSRLDGVEIKLLTSERTLLHTFTPPSLYPSFLPSFLPSWRGGGNDGKMETKQNRSEICYLLVGTQSF